MILKKSSKSNRYNNKNDRVDYTKKLGMQISAGQ